MKVRSARLPRGQVPNVSGRGDATGSIGGIVSNCTKGKAQFIAYSFDVKAEGQNIPRNMDMMKHNGSSSYNAVG